eukprot:EC124281.1.p1 GENE.EC124281.1~~EC124281.1.p1  ORF type:complete len:116 (+),score=21.04 EC124281.1:118-465(+)
MSLDDDHRKQIIEVQERMKELQRQVVVLQTQMQVKDRSKRRDELTLRELQALPPSVPTYMPVGKMFLLTEHSELGQKLQSSITSREAELSSMQKSKTYVERQLRDAEGNLKDLVK